jgi:hypothetical protein
VRGANGRSDARGAGALAIGVRSNGVPPLWAEPRAAHAWERCASQLLPPPRAPRRRLVDRYVSDRSIVRDDEPSPRVRSRARLQPIQASERLHQLEPNESPSHCSASASSSIGTTASCSLAQWSQSAASSGPRAGAAASAPVCPGTRMLSDAPSSGCRSGTSHGKDLVGEPPSCAARRGFLSCAYACAVHTLSAFVRPGSFVSEDFRDERASGVACGRAGGVCHRPVRRLAQRQSQRGLQVS